MPVYEGRKPKTWRVVIWAGGKSNEWVVPGRRKDALSFEAAKRIELDAGKKLSIRTAPTWRDFCALVYEPHAKKHLSESTWNKVRRYQITTLSLHFGDLRLTDFSAQHVEAFKRARDVKASSINNELRVLRTVLNFAREMGYPVATFNFKKVPVRGAPRVHVWSTTQIDALFCAAAEHDPDLLPLLVFLANTGCRKGEGIACEWGWVDAKKEMLRIPSNEVWRPKNGMPREVPLSRTMLAMLSGPVEERRHERWVFPNRNGARYADFPKDRFNALRLVAGLRGGPHTLRHSFASLFLASCPDMFLLAQVLGHSHQRVTEVYSHLLPEHLSRARNAVDLAPAMAAANGTMAETMADTTVH